MTKKEKEAIKMLKSKMDGHTDTSYEWAETVRIAIKALEQQSIDAVDRMTIKEYLYNLGMGIKVTTADCISREETLKALMDEWTEFDSELIDYLIEKVKKLPPVTPQPKMGYWRDTGSGQECSRCNEIQYGYDSFRKYCANCGSYNAMEVNDD